jgi:ArsR family transcriptional regulator, repressor of sdpIR and other operons
MNNQVFKALADPTRREILRLLAGGEMSAGALAERFEMTKPTVSHHFSVLKEAELIISRREGQQVIYALNTTVAQDVLAWLWDLLGGALNLEPAARRQAERPRAKRGSETK